jgi:3-oxoacyl-[acyl-carrier protein] reductase
MNLELEDKVVLMTGATGGIGGQIAADFLAEGSVVVCLVRNLSKLAELKAVIKESGIAADKLHAETCDLFSYKDIKATVERVAAKFLRIDILVNCAGYADEYPFALLDEEQIEKMIDFNFKSPVFLSHAVLRPMFRQKGGCIINISSVSAIKKGRGIATYAAAKAGLDAFTRTLSHEVGRKNIRVNAIRPGVIDTAMSGAVISRHEKRINESTALARVGKAPEISKAVLFIASEKTASYLTGECITIDGGMY